MLKNLKNKNILVTSGGTQEYIDDFRILTNISTGKLGAITADTLTNAKANVFFVHGKTSVLPKKKMQLVQSVKSTQNALEAIQNVIQENEIHAVVHAMAVSDFTFKKSASIKCKSTDPKAFIEYMSKTIAINPKIISYIKKWNPNIKLIGFKFEIDLTIDEQVALAKKSINTNKCDLVIINDKKEMQQQKQHIARFVFPEISGFNKTIQYNGKTEIASGIETFLKDIL